jgi:hypothetical protein
MKKKSLFESNPYLQDPKKYRESLITSVSSSTVIETGASLTLVKQQLSEVSNTPTPPTPSESKPQ